LTNATYAEALVGWETVTRGQVVHVAKGGQGARLGQFRRWLYRLPDVREPERIPAFQGEARIAGVLIKRSQQEIRDIALGEFDVAGPQARRFRHWVVEINGRRMSPKWLVSVLSGVPVQRFQAAEARRALAQLGIEVNPVRR